ncbi:MAG: hypothetical protein DWQ34_03015 [Planctomycetota bacterium]|nr:MAG: hypothetical protein DWQ29_12800 [Planctomycetota bacterium]REJ97013.1 MAG: hypothetical protein DWQ34_03015 [Planctomycetota bacterium]REK20136.1 MAG: hypothetical protein DWQ41_26450 [Planctomycetota bacterium]REK34326.1 MAG: hypothetical protein DWQ45_13685 [Planctomycetota bacterium]
MSVFDLWLPILAAGLATHVMSTLAWTVLPHHKPEWKKFPQEDKLLGLIDEGAVPAEQYIFPHAADAEEMKSEEFQQKQQKCRGTLILWPSPINMGAAIGKTLAFFFIAAFCIGYVASLAVEPGATFFRVFRVVATVALLTHCFGIFPNVFWFKQKVLLDLADKVAYALATGLIFAALWPSA